MSNALVETRKSAVNDLIARARAVLDMDSLNREALATIRAELEAVAAREELWSQDDFPTPGNEHLHNRYRVSNADDDGLALYFNVMRPGKQIFPHNHTTWACVAAVSGVEYNTLYDRVDDGSVPSAARLREREVIEVAPGTAVALMPDDIHSVETRGTEAIRHLHLYGQPLETLTHRKQFDIASGTYKIMDIGVKSIGLA